LYYIENISSQKTYIPSKPGILSEPLVVDHMVTKELARSKFGIKNLARLGLENSGAEKLMQVVASRILLRN
jgi:hypothetical protein